jgi:hypothetical protein
MTNCAAGRGYAATVAALGDPPTSGGQPFISPDLSSTGTITKSGYDITFAAIGLQQTGVTTCSTISAVTQGYDALAAPSSANVTGVRTLGTNEGAAIFEDPDGSAPVAFDVFPSRAPTNGTAIQ